MLGAIRYSQFGWGLIVLVLSLSGCRRLQLQVQQPAPLPQDPFVQVFFNHNQSSSYTEPYRHQTRTGDNLEQIIVDTIQSAQATVDVAVHELRLPQIAVALAERQQAGVQVRVILEDTYSRPWSTLTAAEVTQLDARGRSQYQEFHQLINRNGDAQISQEEIKRGDALTVLKNAGISWIDDTADGSAGSGLMHHKFLVVDGRTVLITSANFTPSDIHGDFEFLDSRGNPNALLKIDSPQLAASFIQEFDFMWGDGPGNKPDSLFGVQKPFRPAQQIKLEKTAIAVQFSPTSRTIPWEQSVNGLIGSTLSRAAASVDLALFVFSEQFLSTVLEARHRQGVEVRSLIEPDYAYKSYSEGLDMLGVALAQSDQVGSSGYCRFEAGNTPWQQPIKTVGVAQLPKGDRLHHKFGIVDHQTVIVGSHNWSEAADQNNDENLLVIDSPVVAAHFVREFERLYAGAKLGLPKFLQRQIQNQQSQCHPTAIAPVSQSANAGSPTPRSIQSSQTPAVGRVNLNTASQEELENLPGVGPKLAERIIAARQQRPFTSLADLDQVSGMGPHVMEQLKGQVSW